jgi:enoyl-CoA hydratase/carnithine racemase
MTDLLVEIADGVAVVTFDRPEVLNACTRSTIEELLAALERVRDDEGAGALVITGRGRGFCAGEDLRELGDLLADPAAVGAAMEPHLAMFQEVTRRLVALPKPTIAAVNGVAVGFGAELAVACDIRLAAEEATIGFVEVKRALFETNGVTYLLPRLVGRGHAIELLLGGERVTAVEALRIGLVNHVFPGSRLMEEAVARAHALARNAPIPVRLLKELLGREMDLETAMTLELEALRRCLASDDLREGVRSFLERRPPVYRGR